MKLCNQAKFLYIVSRARLLYTLCTIYALLCSLLHDLCAEIPQVYADTWSHTSEHILTITGIIDTLNSAYMIYYVNCIM